MRWISGSIQVMDGKVLINSGFQDLIDNFFEKSKFQFVGCLFSEMSSIEMLKPFSFGYYDQTWIDIHFQFDWKVLSIATRRTICLSRQVAQTSTSVNGISKPICCTHILIEAAFCLFHITIISSCPNTTSFPKLIILDSYSMSKKCVSIINFW